MDTVVLDANGAKLEVGTQVWVGPPTDPANLGVVESISDPDGDVDDEGRGVAINPSVAVKFGDGTKDAFTTWWTGTGPWDSDDTPYKCDDVESA